MYYFLYAAHRQGRKCRQQCWSGPKKGANVTVDDARETVGDRCGYTIRGLQLLTESHRNNMELGTDSSLSLAFTSIREVARLLRGETRGVAVPPAGAHYFIMWSYCLTTDQRIVRLPGYECKNVHRQRKSESGVGRVSRTGAGRVIVARQIVA